MTKGETITYNGVTYEVKQDEHRNIYPCDKCDLCKDFIEPFDEDEIEEVCDFDCLDHSLYLKRKEEQQCGTTEH